MSFGLSKGRDLDASSIEVPTSTFPPLPDDVLSRPEAGHLPITSWFTDPSRPLEIEIGSGKGTFLLNQAAADPDTNYLGFEWAGEFFLYAADRIRRRGLTNVRMLKADATEFLRWRCPSSCARVIHLYYSDPWPKRKHHKNRVVQHAFLEQCFRTLAPNGELRVVTDHDELWAWDQDHFNAWTRPHDNPASPDPVPAHIRAACASTSGTPFTMQPFVPPPWVGEGQTIATNYEKKMCEAVGKQPHACVLKKTV